MAMSPAPAPVPAPFTRPALHALWITAVSAVVSFGFSLAALGLIDTDEDTYPYVLYNLARAIVLLLAVAVVARERSTGGVLVVGALTALMQFFDAIVGAVDSDPTKTFGPLAIAILSGVLVLRLYRSTRTTSQAVPAAAPQE